MKPNHSNQFMKASLFLLFVFTTYCSFALEINNTKIKIEKKDIICYRGGMGEINIILLDLTQSFEFQLVSKENNKIIHDWSTTLTYTVPKGIYEIKSRDKLTPPNEFSDIIEIFEPAELKIADVTVSQQPFDGNSNGEIQIQIEGGTKPYALIYQKNDNKFDTISNFSGYVKNIPKGNFTFFVKDNANCGSLSGSKIVTPVLSYNLETDVQSITCSGQSFKPGSITLIFSEGVPPYTVEFDGGKKTIPNPGSHVIPLKEAKKYNIIFKDGQGSTPISVDFTNVKCTLKVKTQVTKDATTTDQDAGTVKITVDGTSPYYCEIFDSNGQKVVSKRAEIQTSTFDFTGLKEGSYIAKVTDGHGAAGESESIIITAYKVTGEEAEFELTNDLKEFFRTQDRIKLKKKRIENTKKVIGYATTAVGLAGAYLSAGATQVLSLFLGFGGQVYSQENGGDNGKIAKCERALIAAETLYFNSLKEYIEDPLYFKTWDDAKRAKFSKDSRALKSLLRSKDFSEAPQSNVKIDKLKLKYTHDSRFTY